MKTIVLATIVLAAALVPIATSEEDVAVVEQESGRFLFGNYQTSTVTVVSASTSTVYLSCLSGTSSLLCAGRRRRKRTAMEPTPLDIQSVAAVELDASSNLENERVERSTSDDKQKFGFTIWTTSKTTTTVTVMYTNTESTVRLSYYCTAAGIAVPSLSCSG